MTDAPNDNRHITIPQTLQSAETVGALLGVHARTIHNWARRGIIPTAIREGRTVRFDSEAVFEALKERTHAACRDLSASAGESARDA